MRWRQIAAACRAEAKGALIAVGIGVVISGLFGMAQRSPARILVFIFHGAVTGLLIYTIISVFEILFRQRIERIPRESSRTFAHVLLFSAGGAIGWFLGMAIALQNLATLLDARWLGVMFLTVATVIGVGLLFRSFEVLNARLREREWTEKELEIARSIQKRLLPPQEVESAGYALAARNLPAQIVAGDFYDFVRLDDGSVAVVVADVAGKGIGASLIMASVKAVLPFVASQPVSDVMAVLNQKLVQELHRREFVAMAYGRFYVDTGRLEVANAGFPDPYLVHNGHASVLTVGGTRLPLGIRADARYETLVAQLGPGDRVVFVSDGIPEAQISGGDSLGYEKLQEIIDSTHARTPAAWLDAFLTAIRERVGTTLTDDWTAVVVERKA